MDGGREDDGRSCFKTCVLCDVLGDRGDLYAILAELGEVIVAEDGREEARIIGCIL